MARKVTLQSNSGFGWTFGTTGKQLVELDTDAGFGWKFGEPVPVSAPVNTALPAIPATAKVGTPISVSNGTWTGNPAPAFTYQWKRAGANISGATNATYNPVTIDAGAVITCTVTATNSQGTANATSNATAAVTMAPANTVAPAITGTAQVSQPLTVSNGTWTGTPAPTFAYQWKANGTNISGAASATYAPVAGDVTKTITCTVTASNAAGSASKDSNATAAVVA